MPSALPSSAKSFRNCLLQALALMVCVLPVVAQGAIFDWDQAYAVSPAASGTPTAGNSVSKSYDNDQTHSTTSTVNDVTITLANAVGTWSSPRPAVDTNYDGGTGKKALSLGFSKESNTTQGLTVTIDFNYVGGVTNVNFQIFDVDYSAGTWIDKIDQIWATTTTSGTVGPSSVVGSADNVVSGTGLTFAATGTNANSLNTSAGNVSIDFGTAKVTSITFRWRNVDNGKGDQKIGLGDINYTQVTPEVNPGLAAMALCAIAVGFRSWKGRKK